MFGLRLKWSCPFELLPLGPYHRLWDMRWANPCRRDRCEKRET